MLASQNDPLRFLKPRKKQFHLTPKKGPKLSFKQQQTLQNIRVESELKKTLQSTPPITKSQVQNKNRKQILIWEKNQTRNVPFTFQYSEKYDPYKYFSWGVQQYLNKNKTTNIKSSFESQRKPNQIPSIKNKNLDSIDKSFQQTDKIRSKDLIIPLKEKDLSDPNETTVRLEDYFQTSKNQNTQQNSIANQHQISFSSQVQENNQREQKEQKGSREVLPIQSKGQKINVFSKKSYFKEKNYQQPHFYAQNYSEHRQNESEKNINFQGDTPPELLQLQSCSTCGRKFNLQSYQKHIKVCQKVFFKKRKEFSSEKQRSQSREKAKNKS